jgi:RNA polymerase sigma factor (sigma-70 family)
MPESFETAYPGLLQRAYRAAYSVVGRRDEAEDVACEAMARAWSRWSKVADHAEPWTVKVAANLAIDALRRKRWDNPQVLIDEGPTDVQPESRLDLVAALQDLPRRQREVVTLRYLGDLTEQETAQTLGIDVGTVKSHAARGLAHLRIAAEFDERHA